MYSIYQGKIYYIVGDKAKECVIKGGKLVETNNIVEKPNRLDNLLTYRELQLKYAQVFNKEDYVEEKPKTKTFASQHNADDEDIEPKVKSSTKLKEE